MVKVSFNMNDKVYVKLTQKGVDILKRKREEESRMMKDNLRLPEFKLIEGDIYETQLWVLMSEFGEHLYNGCEIPFETTITID